MISLYTFPELNQYKIDHAIDFSKPNKDGYMYDLESFIAAISERVATNEGIPMILVSSSKGYIRNPNDMTKIIASVFEVQSIVTKSPYILILPNPFNESRLSCLKGWDLYANPVMDVKIDDKTKTIYTDVFYYWKLGTNSNWK